MIPIRSSRRLGWGLFLGALLSFTGSAAQADVASGLAWLKARDSANGVYRGSDLADSADTNAETYITAATLSHTTDFPGLAAKTLAERDDSLLSVARLASDRISQGQSGAEQLTELLAAQQTDGGFPPARNFQSEALTTAWALTALDRAGRGAQTEASRALSYLVGAQQADGGWLAAAGNNSSVFVTAQVTRALVDYRNRYNLAQQLTKAKAFLDASRSASNTYGDTFETALALEALVKLGADRAGLAPVATALAALQSGDGSFGGDGYVTAIAVRALWLVDQPVIEPQQAAITGRVLSADTNLPISGATLALSGASIASLNSNDTGRFQSNTLAAGAYNASLSYPGMRTVEFTLTLANGRTLDLGDIRMYQGASGGDDLALIRGLITASGSGTPIANATVQIDNPPVSVTTGADGRYQILQIPAGHVHITVSATGYASRFGDVDVTVPSIIEFSPALDAVNNPQTGATIRGTILNGVTNAPLAGVSVAVTNGTPVSTLTDAAGNYTLQAAANPMASIVAAKPGYDSVTIGVALHDNEVVPFSPRLYPTGQTPTDANQGRIHGVIVNQANRQPIENALIVANDPGGQHVARSDSTGAFAVVGVAGPVTRLAITADAFDPATLAVPLQPLEDRNVGEIGLKPTTVSYYFPDLVLTESTLADTDPDTFGLDSQFALKVSNHGTSGTTQDFTVLAFVDANGNGKFDAGVEPEVGRVRVDKDLPVGASADVNIAVKAQLTFRDAPISFWVDAEDEIPEQNENNNVGSSLLGCRVTPSFVGNDTIEEKWRWDGLSSNRQINSLNATPTVIQLNDDNGDGVINQYDIPDVVFVAGARSSIAPGATALVALDGKTGHELWSRSDFTLSQFSSVVAGDIDNDGVAEIIAVRGYREELLAFENDGTLKWRVPLNGPGIPQVLIPPPPHVYDQPIIVNLQGDNEGEVILGRQAFRGKTGEKLWEGEFDSGGDAGKPTNAPLRVAFGVASIAADINLDGKKEVVAGRTAYDAEGHTLWHRGDIEVPIVDSMNPPRAYAGYNAVGNFNTDDYPEIVLTIGTQLYLLDHNGNTIWGPKFAPDFGEMGAPTLADVDGDGLPEIIVSTNTKLTVFESDGTVKRTFDIEDVSGVTSPTVFDFENDGLPEVVHMDEKNLRILDARTLVQRFKTANTSLTVYEVPVIADVDGDKQADLIITGYDYDLSLPSPGIRVFHAKNGAWADAGSVWSAESFHINEINEDSTLPLIETPSWLTHNTYRVQRSPLPDPLGMPDFSVGDLRLIDQGPGHNPVVQVRVGNAGPVDAHEPPYIGVYRGNPATGGTLLKEVRLDTLRPARFQIVNLGEIPVTGHGDLYAVADQRNRARECREGNNQRSIPFLATNGRGDLQLATDKLSYRPGDSASFTANVANQGAIAAGFTVEWFVRNSQGVVTANLATQTVDSVAASATAVRTLAWPTDGVLAGNYVLEGRLHNAAGSVIDTATAAFAIAGDVSGPAGAVSLSTPKTQYGAGEAIRLDFRALNLSASEVLRLPEVTIAITGPAGFSQQRTFDFDDLFPNTSHIDQMGVESALAAGDYTATAHLTSRLTGAELATDTTHFTRLADVTAAIQGFVEVVRPSLMAGETENCLFTVRNRGTGAQMGAVLRQRVVALEAGTIHSEQTVTTDLVPGTDYVANQNVDTSGYSAADHACVIEMQAADGSWHLLDSKPFTVIAQADAGFIVTPTSGLVTSEAGQTATFTIALTRPPTADVTVQMTASNTGEWQIATPSVTITPATWNVPHIVTVLGVDDQALDGDQVGTIVLQPATSADAAFAGLDPPDVGITNLDNDGASIIVSPTSLTTSESGSSATFNVRLNSAPTAAVQIALNNPDATEWNVPASVTLDASNWQAGATVTVTGVDDAEFDGTQHGVLVLAAATSADAHYNGINPADVSLNNLDDEQAAIVVDPTTVETAEGGAPGLFTVRLNRAPTAPVTIPIGPVDASEWQVLDTSIVLDASNWSTGRSVVVTPVDDDVVDGDQTATLVLGVAQSSDGLFAGKKPSNVTLINRDNDTARIVVTPTSGLVVDEGGASATFAISLTDAPTADVSIGLTSGDATEFALGTNSVTFTPQDWTPRTVVVTGVDDADVDGNIVGKIVTAKAVSTDVRYNGIDPADVGVTNLDNETVQINVTPGTPVITSESGTSATISLRLSVAPTQPVHIAVVNPDSTEWSLDKTELEFLPADGTAPQTVTVTGVDDLDVDGDISGVIGFAPAISDDARYNGIDAVDVPALNRDDDVAPAVIVDVNGGIDTSEDGTTASFSVRLSTKPSADVVIPVTNPDTTEWSADHDQIRFTTANWQTAQTVTVTGVDDAVVDGDIHGSFVLGAAQSSDARYAGIDPADVPAINRDNDSTAPQVIVQPIAGVDTSENGTTATFTVSISQAPTAEVVIPLTNPDATEWSLDHTELRFTANNWQTPQTVIITGVDDAIVDGDIHATIVLGAIQSGDQRYAGIDPDDVPAVNRDNDNVRPTVTVSPGAGIETSESGTTALITVSLGTAPTADVVIALSNPDTTEWQLDRAELRFTPVNWQTPQQVTVTGVDDAVIDGDIHGTIGLAAIVSDDVRYAGIDPSDVPAVNHDNDAATPVVTVSPGAGIETSENGTTAVFTVSLDTAPSADVVIPLSNPDTTEWSLDQGEIRFTPANWQTPQHIVVTGVDDNEIDGDIHGTIGLGAILSNDVRYAGIDPADVPAINRDNDGGPVAWRIEGTDLAVSESGDTGLVRIAFDRLPTADVHVHIASADTGEVTVTPADLVFTAANATTAQDVVLHGVDEHVADGMSHVALNIRVASTTDAVFAALPAQNVTATNADDDVAGVNLALVGASSVTEGEFTSFHVNLGSQPTAPVTLQFEAVVAAPDSPTSVTYTLQPTSLLLDPTQWQSGGDLVLDTSDNGMPDAARVLQVRVAHVASTDTTYAALASANVPVTVRDRVAAPVAVPSLRPALLVFLLLGTLLLGAATLPPRR